MKVKHNSITSKLSRLMRICAAQAMIAFILGGIATANTGYSQLLDKEITISLKDVTLETALLELGKMAEVKFAYSLDQMNVKVRVSVEADRTPLGKVLDELLTPHRIRYKISDRDLTIFLKRDNGKASQQSVKLRSDNVQYYQVTGRVTDVNSQPMAGVNVLVKGTTNGTSTDSEGAYALSAISENDILVFSFIGYNTTEVRIDSKAEIDVVLIEDVSTLKEVIVNAGYWEVDRKEGTGNISQVTSKEIEKQPVSNPLLALQGRMPGVVITQNTGISGGAISIRIRGQNSLRSEGNYPLYVIDGVPVDSRPIESFGSMVSMGFDPLNMLSPSNIESIEILKDADATSIYGSRGANGVVLITTKRGKQGKTNFEASYYTGAGQITRRMPLLNTTDYLAMREEAFANDAATPSSSDYDLNGVWDRSAQTDWQNLLFGNSATVHDAQAAISGGIESTSFRIGGSIRNETTVFPGEFGYRRATGALSLQHSSQNKKLRITVNANYGSENNSLFNRNVVYDALTLSPNAPLYNASGDLDWTGYSVNQKNPLSYTHVTHDTRSRSLISNAIVSYELLPRLRIKANFGYTDASTDELINMPKSSMDPANQIDSQSNFGMRKSDVWIAEPQISWEKTWSDHHIDLLIGGTWQSTSARVQWIQATGFLSDGLLGNINAATTVTSQRDEATMYRYNAGFGRINYKWKERYLFNLTARRDGSSRFGPDRQFANFGAIGVAWILSNEAFLSNINILSFGKLRGSYGTSGSDQIGDYGYLSTYNTSAFTFQGTKPLVPTGLANADYGWEVNKKLEAAMDIGFADDRIQFTTSWYKNRSSNQLVGYQLPSVTGFSSVQANLNAVVENSGWEFELTTRNFDAEHFRWTTSLNLTIPTNRLVSYPNIESSSYADTYEVGQPLSIRKLYHYTGVDPLTGLYQFEDYDANGSYSSEDRRSIVNLGRTWYGGINNSVSWKGFDLSIFFEYVRQNSQDYYAYFLNAPGTMSNQPIWVRDRWDTGNSNGQAQRFTQSYTDEYQRMLQSDQNITSSSFLRCKNISLSYTIPVTLAAKAGIKNISVFLRGQNVFTITDYKGLEPDNAGNIQLPQLRMVTGGLNLNL